MGILLQLTRSLHTSRAVHNTLKYNDKVAVITGAARGLGREYALLLASRGANIVVNDLGGSRDGDGKSAAADEVVNEIKQAGGKAVADYNSVEEGDKIIKTAIDSFGRVDILINNAGILRDKSILKMTPEEFDLIYKIHLRGSFLATKAAWPYFRDQNFGRVIMTSSPAGIYGNFGQANYSAAKLALLALAKTLAVEGGKNNIFCNTIVPVAASRLTEDLMPEDVFEMLHPKYVAPIVAYLCHDSCEANGEVLEAAGGYYGRYEWRRSAGKVFSPEVPTLENIRDSFGEICDMSKSTTHPNVHQHTMYLVNQISGEEDEDDEGSDSDDDGVAKTSMDEKFVYTANDSILYNLAVGVEKTEKGSLNYLYESSADFMALPTYAATIGVNFLMGSTFMHDVIDEYKLEDNLMRALHGEQYLKAYKPFPTEGKLHSEAKVIDVLDKGTGALIIAGLTTYDENNEPLFYNQMSTFMVGSGEFGGKRSTEDSSVVHCIDPPNRDPDAVVSQKTTEEQAALFRLCGDKNPLHIDPQLAGAIGYKKPILHGLCFFGFAVRHVLREFANYDASRFDCVKVRFAGTVDPGQTIETKMWKEQNGNLTRVHFECFVKETGNKVISSAFVDLKPEGN